VTFFLFFISKKRGEVGCQGLEELFFLSFFRKKEKRKKKNKKLLFLNRKPRRK